MLTVDCWAARLVPLLLLGGAASVACDSSQTTVGRGSGGVPGTTGHKDAAATGGTTSTDAHAATGGSSSGDGSANPRDGGPRRDAGRGVTDGGGTIGASVLQHHRSPTRDGFYVDTAFTTGAIKNLHRDASFSATIVGNVYAQLLFLDGQGTSKDVLFAATESNNVYAVDAATGTILWQRNVGTPAMKGQM